MQQVNNILNICSTTCAQREEIMILSITTSQLGPHKMTSNSMVLVTRFPIWAGGPCLYLIRSELRLFLKAEVCYVKNKYRIAAAVKFQMRSPLCNQTATCSMNSQCLHSHSPCTNHITDWWRSCICRNNYLSSSSCVLPVSIQLTSLIELQVLSDYCMSRTILRAKSGEQWHKPVSCRTKTWQNRTRMNLL